MYGESIKVGGKEYFVYCTPHTPRSEILTRAARMAAAEEDALLNQILSQPLHFDEVTHSAVQRDKA